MIRGLMVCWSYGLLVLCSVGLIMGCTKWDVGIFSDWNPIGNCGLYSTHYKLEIVAYIQPVMEIVAYIQPITNWKLWLIFNPLQIGNCGFPSGYEWSAPTSPYAHISMGSQPPGWDHTFVRYKTKITFKLM